jgi:hypothetical protein
MKPLNASIKGVVLATRDLKNSVKLALVFSGI